jgi:hypothetical protein
MAFADPQSVTINAVAVSLPRTGLALNQGTFQSNDGTLKLSASHAYGKRVRHNVRIDHSKISADVFQADTNIRQSMSTYLVVDVPLTGYTVTEAKAVVDGFIAKLTASSGQLVTQLLGGES